MNETRVRKLMPSWEEFEADYLAKGMPGNIQILDAPVTHVMAEPGGDGVRLVVTIPGPPIEPIRGLRGMVVSIIRNEPAGESVVSIRSAERRVREVFYSFAEGLIGDLDSGADPMAAMKSRLKMWRLLLRTSAMLSEERQIGLIGELWLLRRLTDLHGPRAVESWLGPTKQAHDVRINGNDIEVKVTRLPRRDHIISNLAQMTPGEGRRLFLLSLQVAPSGLDDDGMSISGLVESLLADYRGTDAEGSFIELLKDAGIPIEDVAVYEEKWHFRSKPTLVEVDAGIPRITQAAIDSLPREFAPERIGALVSYQINVDGLGVEEGTPEFSAVIPAAPTAPAEQ